MLQLAICDDDQEDLTQIENTLKSCLLSHHIQHNITTYHSGDELLQSEKEYQIYLLDVSLHESRNGIDLGREIHNRNKLAPIIYITSYEEYCKQAVNQVHAFAYLDKPVAQDKLEQHILDAIDLYEKQIAEKKKQVLGFEVMVNEETTSNKMFVKIPLDDICYFEYYERKVKICMINGTEYFFQEKMKNLTNRMKQYHFELCHQSYLVNLAQVKSVKGYEVSMQNGQMIPLAQKKSAEFRSALNEYMQQNV